MEPLRIWSDEVDFPVTICDKEGLIVGMNKNRLNTLKMMAVLIFSADH